MPIEVTFSLYDEDDAGVEHEYEVTANFWPAVVGKTEGDPENCWPDVPADVEVVMVKRDGVLLDPAAENKFSEDRADDIYDAAVEAAAQDAEPDPDRYRD
jgi:hypothetical protein